ALFHCEELRQLNLSDNELQSIPAAISSLHKLEELNCSKNHILQLPDSIRQCKLLMIVEASINPLGPRLPDSLTQLINLRELFLNDTFLEFLPANFGKLTRLQIVELRENHLKTLPKSINRLVELRRLDIGQNDFIEFPDVIGSLCNLNELWCDFNKLVTIPDVSLFFIVELHKNKAKQITSIIYIIFIYLYECHLFYFFLTHD
ncbi:LAP1-like protein, partial [Euroglyphus maynei]